MKRLLVIGLLVGLLVVSTTAVFAAPMQEDGATVVKEGDTVNNDIALFGKDLAVRQGGFVKGDVVVFGGNAQIDGQIKGNVVLFGGNLEIANKIDGDLVLFGGNVTASEGASILGDCVLLGGNLENNAGASLGCSSAGTFAVPNIITAVAQDMPKLDINVPDGPRGRSFVGEVVGAIFSSLFAGFLAFVAAVTLPQHMERIERTVRQKPMASGAVGVLTAVAIPAIIALLVPISIILLFVCVGILGFPIMLVLGVGLVAGSVLGWVTVGHMVGDRLFAALGMKRPSMPVTAALGAAAMTLVINALGIVTFGAVDGLLTFVVTSVGLGAVALTQFGTKAYPFLATATKRVVESDDEGIVVDDDKLTAVLRTLPHEDDTP